MNGSETHLQIEETRLGDGLCIRNEEEEGISDNSQGHGLKKEINGGIIY